MIELFLEISGIYLSLRALIMIFLEPLFSSYHLNDKKNNLCTYILSVPVPIPTEMRIL